MSIITRLKREPSPAAADQAVLERAVIEEAGQRVALGALDLLLERLGVLEGDRDVRRKELDEIEVGGRVAIRRAETLEGQHAHGAVPVAQRDADDAAVDGAIAPEVVDPRVVRLVLDELRLVVVDDPWRDALLAGLPRLEVLGGVDALAESGMSRPLFLSTNSMAMLSDRTRAFSRSVIWSSTDETVERAEDRLGDLEEVALAAQLALEDLGLRRAVARSCRRWPSPGRRSWRR